MAAAPEASRRNEAHSRALIQLLDRWGRLDVRDVDRALQGAAKARMPVEAWLVAKGQVARPEVVRALRRAR